MGEHWSALALNPFSPISRPTSRLSLTLQCHRGEARGCRRGAPARTSGGADRLSPPGPGASRQRRQRPPFCIAGRAGRAREGGPAWRESPKPRHSERLRNSLRRACSESVECDLPHAPTSRTTLPSFSLPAPFPFLQRHAPPGLPYQLLPKAPSTLPSPSKQLFCGRRRRPCGRDVRRPREGDRPLTRRELRRPR